jgi:dihydropteroate synthase
MSDFTFSVRGQLRTLSFPCIAGILNVTDDSFYAGSRITHVHKLLSTAEAMIIQGASILDIGAVSTRPGADLFTERDEILRLIPYLKSLRKKFPDILISVDTFRSEVAKIAADEGADIINDISGGTMDEQMFHVVASLKLPYILMHIQGTPENMQKKTQYSDLMNDINYFFAQQIHKAQDWGVHDIIIDPGFGFGKTIEQNFEILNKLELLRIHNKPVYVGLSRKSMIYKTLDSTPDHALTGTIALHTLALTKGANILRVHDVREASEVVSLMKKMMSLQ